MMKKYRLYVITFWIIFVFLMVSFFGIFYSASVGYLGEMPDFRQLENPKTNFASEIISSFRISSKSEMELLVKLSIEKSTSNNVLSINSAEIP